MHGSTGKYVILYTITNYYAAFAEEGARDLVGTWAGGRVGGRVSGRVGGRVGGRVCGRVGGWQVSGYAGE